MNYKDITKVAVNALENIKGENIVVIDTSHKSPIFSTIIVCSGNSNRQVSALAHSVSEEFKLNHIDIIGTEGERSGEWVLVDSGDVVVHIMLPHVRHYYDLETLWDDKNYTK